MPTTASNLQQVKGYLQAFDHLCAIEEWERAMSLITRKLNTPSGDPLYYQLKLWGYAQERTELYQALVDHANHRGNESWNARGLQFLGESYATQGKYHQAKACYERSLSIFNTIGNAEDIGMLFSVLGEVYYALGDHDQAITHQTKFLHIAKAENLQYGEGIALGNLGIIAYELSHYDEALTLMNQQLSIVVEIGDLAREAQALGNLGNVHVALGNTCILIVQWLINA